MSPPAEWIAAKLAGLDARKHVGITREILQRAPWWHWVPSTDRWYYDGKGRNYWGELHYHTLYLWETRGEKGHD